MKFYLLGFFSSSIFLDIVAADGNVVYQPSLRASRHREKYGFNNFNNHTLAPKGRRREQESTYCGCPKCNQGIWDALATDSGGTYSCGGRISWVQTSDGGSLPEYGACVKVANEFPNICGGCNPDNPFVCVGTPPPTTPPTPSPSKEACPETHCTVKTGTTDEEVSGGLGWVCSIENNIFPLNCVELFEDANISDGTSVEKANVAYDAYYQEVKGQQGDRACCFGDPDGITNCKAEVKCSAATMPPTAKPTNVPAPTRSPTDKPTNSPTPDPTNTTPAPSKKPTSEPTTAPTNKPTYPPTPEPTNEPTPAPTKQPTNEPSPAPSKKPTASPTTNNQMCGCSTCTEDVLISIANGNTCGSRINWVIENNGYTEANACKLVGDEYPSICGKCHTDYCGSFPETPTTQPTNEPTPTPSKKLTASPAACPEPYCKVKAGISGEQVSGALEWVCGSQNTIFPINCVQLFFDTGVADRSNIDKANVAFDAYYQGMQDGRACCFGNADGVTECKTEVIRSGCGDGFLDEPNPSFLTWQDEFDVNGSPDPTKWTYDLGDGCPDICGWGNQEKQWYTSDQNNANIENGVLRITARKSSQHSLPYTSARMVTRGLHSFKYGRIRFRARLAGCTSIGTWPALWMLPENWLYGGWPRSGEIDVMETVGHEVDTFFGTVHTYAYNHGLGTEKGGSINKLKSEWHVFEVNWEVNKIQFAIDKQIFYEFFNEGTWEKWPFDKDFHLLMNIAVGGTWGGAAGIDDAAFDGDGQYMEVDYVRVYSQ